MGASDVHYRSRFRPYCGAAYGESNYDPRKVQCPECKALMDRAMAVAGAVARVRSQ